MWKFSSHIYILARRWCCLKNRQVLKCHWTCTKSLIVKRAAPDRLACQQFCDFLFCPYHDLMYNEPFTWQGPGHLTLSFVKEYFGVVWLNDALYSRAFYFWCSQKSPRNSEDPFKTSQNQKLPAKFEGGWRETEILKASKERKKHANFQPWNWLQKKKSGLSHQQGKVSGRCGIHSLASGILGCQRNTTKGRGKYYMRRQ